MKTRGLIGSVRAVLQATLRPALGLQVIGVATLMALVGGGWLAWS